MNISRPLGGLFIGLLLSFPALLFGQCPAGDVILSSQADVNQFLIDYPSCSSVIGDLVVGDHIAPFTDSDITDLSGLTGISEIGGNFVIRANPSLTSLNGLSGITEITGNLDIIENSGLLDISGISSLQQVMLYVNILDNASLGSISGFNDLIVNFILTVKNNDNLTSISGLNNLVANRAVVIAGNDALTTISGLNSINAGLTFGLMDNTVLSNVTGFSYAGAIAPVAVSGNTQLAACNVAGICDAVLAGLANTFNANGTGCSSAFDVQSACLSGLPVELVDFEVVNVGAQIQLNWKTISEQNNLGFDIEYSLNGINWNSLGFIEGHRNSTTTKEYSFRHEAPQGGKNYYRLKQVDYDGQYAYSEIKTVNLAQINNDQLANVFPNPSAGVVTIQMPTKANTKTWLRLFDTQGHQIWNTNLAAEKEAGIFIKQLDLTSNNLYFLYIQNGSDTEVIKIQTIDEF